MPQDFRAVLRLGEDDKHISTVDAAGVGLAGLGAIHTITLRKDAKIRKLTEEMEELQQPKHGVTALEAPLARLEQAVLNK